MPVITASEFDDEIAARESARQAHGTHGRFGSRRDHPYHLDRRHRLVDQLRQFAFELGRSAEAAAVPRRFDGRGDDARMRMAENHRPPRADVVDVTMVIDVVEVCSLAACDEDRFAADSAERPRWAVDSAGDYALSALEGLMAVESVHCGSFEKRRV